MRLVEPAMAPGTITNVLQKLTVVAQMTRFRSKKMCEFTSHFDFNSGNFNCFFFSWFDKDTCETRAAGYTKFNAGLYFICYYCTPFEIANGYCPDPNDTGDIDWYETTCSSKSGSCGADDEGSLYFLVGFRFY